MEGQQIRVAVVGANGRMGREVLKALTPAEGFQIVAAIDRESLGMNCRDLVGAAGPDLAIEAKVGQALDRAPADVVVDFSSHTGAGAHAQSALKRGASPVIGCTGLSDYDLAEIRRMTAELGVPAMYVPNFAIGAVLMMRFSELAAKWLPNVEIIEMHHDKKEDAPSGTAMLTAEMIHHARKRPPSFSPDTNIKIQGARGGRFLDVPIHSVRLPGLLAHQQVVFGGPGEALTVRHDSLDRSGFMEGVKLCVRTVKSLQGLTVGMDKILFQ
ncbi:MAG TPA: 4-hydroxy-tetrahydrodipicolinate reductase [Fimbriimonas sp.]